MKKISKLLAFLIVGLSFQIAHADTELDKLCKHAIEIKNEVKMIEDAIASGAIDQLEKGLSHVLGHKLAVPAKAKPMLKDYLIGQAEAELVPMRGSMVMAVSACENKEKIMQAAKFAGEQSHIASHHLVAIITQHKHEVCKKWPNAKGHGKHWACRLRP